LPESLQGHGQGRQRTRDVDARHRALSQARWPVEDRPRAFFGTLRSDEREDLLRSEALIGSGFIQILSRQLDNRPALHDAALTPENTPAWMARFDALWSASVGDYDRREMETLLVLMERYERHVSDNPVKENS